MESPILIAGCARSGTSLTAGIIDISGAFGGETQGPNSYNKKGMFENSRVRQDIVKKHLRLLDVDPRGQWPLPETEDLVPVPYWKKDIENVFREQGYRNGPWYYKGPKMCLIWPLWHEAFPEAKWIIVRREDESIAKSCLRTGFMRAFTDIEGWMGWVEEHKKRFQQMHEAGLDVMEVWPKEAIEGDLSEMHEMIEWLGLNWNEKKVKDFIEPDYWGG